MGKYRDREKKTSPSNDIYEWWLNKYEKEAIKLSFWKWDSHLAGDFQVTKMKL